VVVVVLVFALWSPIWFYREKPGPGATQESLFTGPFTDAIQEPAEQRDGFAEQKETPKHTRCYINESAPGRFITEKYGGPPGTQRAMSHNDLGHQGWADAVPYSAVSCPWPAEEDAALEGGSVEPGLEGEGLLDIYKAGAGRQGRSASSMIRSMVRSA
jgi:hypothetical protein